MKRKRFIISASVAGGLLVLCLGVYGALNWFGSPLIPGSLERRYAREVAAHGEELAAFAQACLENGAAPEKTPLPGLVESAALWGWEANAPQDAFVEFSCGGWGLVPSSSYYGFYYSPGGPRAFQGVDVTLTPQSNGYAWQGEGDNHGFAKSLGGDFYYYEAHF